MCTVVTLRRPDHDWPLLLAANRDEMASRPWDPPARHWPDRANVVAGVDRLAGGAWLGVNDDGVVAAVLNRHDSLGPDPRLRSRGELALEALDHADAADAADALSHLDGASYRSFNLVVADNREAFWLKSAGGGAVEARPMPEGLAMLTSRDLDDPASARISRFAPRFAAAPAPDPGAGDWAAWQGLLGSTDHDPAAGPREAMCISTAHGFATLSSSLIALPAVQHPERAPVWLFAPGPPSTTPYAAVPLEGPSGQ